MIHPKVEQAFQEIDACIFSGDGREHADFRDRLSYFLLRWQKGLNDRVLPLFTEMRERIEGYEAREYDDQQST